MTDYERIRDQFNASAVCREGERPRLDYEPGCLFVECAKAEKCRCRYASGDSEATSAFLIEWQRRYAK